MKTTTLCYLIRDGQVLLAMKKRGFGAGKWNGPGGKVEANESIEAACIRETQEETGIMPAKLEARGTVEFVFDGHQDWENVCHVFVATEWTGNACETEEMKPAWFAIEDVPYGEMWADDVFWLDGVLRGGVVNERFYFDESGQVLKHEMTRGA